MPRPSCIIPEATSPRTLFQNTSIKPRKSHWQSRLPQATWPAHPHPQHNSKPPPILPRTEPLHPYLSREAFLHATATWTLYLFWLQVAAHDATLKSARSVPISSRSHTHLTKARPYTAVRHRAQRRRRQNVTDGEEPKSLEHPPPPSSGRLTKCAAGVSITATPASASPIISTSWRPEVPFRCGMPHYSDSHFATCAELSLTCFACNCDFLPGESSSDHGTQS